MVEDGKNKDRASKPGDNIKEMIPIAANPDVSDLIARRLKKYYDEVAEQPVPDRFLDLLSRLEAANVPKKSD